MTELNLVRHENRVLRDKIDVIEEQNKKLLKNDNKNKGHMLGLYTVCNEINQRTLNEETKK